MPTLTIYFLEQDYSNRVVVFKTTSPKNFQDIKTKYPDLIFSNKDPIRKEVSEEAFRRAWMDISNEFCILDPSRGENPRWKEDLKYYGNSLEGSSISWFGAEYQLLQAIVYEAVNENKTKEYT